MVELATLAAIALRVAAALLFVMAGWTKSRSTGDFREIVSNYQLLPDTLATLTAYLLPPIELTLGAALVFAMNRPEPAYAAAGLLSLFAVAMAINLWRGRAFIECGCRPGSAPHARLGWSQVARNLAFAALLTIVASVSTAIEPSAIAIGAVAGLVLFALDHVFVTLGAFGHSAVVRS